MRPVATPLTIVLSLALLPGAGCRALPGSGSADDHAVCTADTGDAQTVADACTRLLAAQPTPKPAERAVLLAHRGTARHVLGDDSAALDDLDAAVHFAPNDAVAVGSRGILRAQQGQFDEAMIDLEAALALDPRNVLAMGNRAIIKEKRGQYREALADVDRALAIDDSGYPLWTERCWIGAVLATDLPRALEDCKHALGMESRDPNNYNNLGFVQFRLGHYRESVTAYDQSIEGDPRMASSYLMRGLAKRALGDTAAADADIAKAASMDPGVAQRYAGYGISTGP